MFLSAWISAVLRECVFASQRLVFHSDACFCLRTEMALTVSLADAAGRSRGDRRGETIPTKWHELMWLINTALIICKLHVWVHITWEAYATCRVRPIACQLICNSGVAPRLKTGQSAWSRRDNTWRQVKGTQTHRNKWSGSRTKTKKDRTYLVPCFVGSIFTRANSRQTFQMWLLLHYYWKHICFWNYKKNKLRKANILGDFLITSSWHMTFY